MWQDFLKSLKSFFSFSSLKPSKSSSLKSSSKRKYQQRPFLKRRPSSHRNGSSLRAQQRSKQRFKETKPFHPPNSKVKNQANRVHGQKVDQNPSVQSKKRPTSQDPSLVYVGVLTHYFAKIQVGVVRVIGPGFKIGDRITIQGPQGQFQQVVSSLQIESQDVSVAPSGKLVGLKLTKEAQVGDKVFCLKKKIDQKKSLRRH